MRMGAIYLAVLSPLSGQVLHQRKFFTSRPSEGKNLRFSFRTFQENNIVILCGVVSINIIFIEYS